MSPPPALLVLVRHAESDRNVAKQGQVFFADDAARQAVRATSDQHTGITALGLRQAEAAGLVLRERLHHLDAVYHSGYRRTELTTTGLLAAWPACGPAGIPAALDVNECSSLKSPRKR